MPLFKRPKDKSEAGAAEQSMALDAATGVASESSVGPDAGKKSGKANPIHEVGATYEGGHPQLQKKARGKLILWPDRLDFQAGKESFTVPIADVIGCELKSAQFGLFDRLLRVRTARFRTRLQWRT